MFQFQLGTIKSAPVESALFEIYSFNSSLVRLKVLIEPIERIEYSRFNSSLVRLKATFFAGIPDRICCFNSSLVRLKEAAALINFLRINMVSIPAWYD